MLERYYDSPFRIFEIRSSSASREIARYVSALAGRGYVPRKCASTCKRWIISAAGQIVDVTPCAPGTMAPSSPFAGISGDAAADPTWAISDAPWEESGGSSYTCVTVG
jgi:hypothetical protein